MGRLANSQRDCEEQQEAAAETGSYMSKRRGRLAGAASSSEKPSLNLIPNKERKVELAVTATDAQEGRWKLMESITLLRRVRSTAAKAAGTSPGEYKLEGDEGLGRADCARAMAAGTSPGEYELEGGEGPGRADRGARQSHIALVVKTVGFKRKLRNQFAFPALVAMMKNACVVGCGMGESKDKGSSCFWLAVGHDGKNEENKRDSNKHLTLTRIHVSTSHGRIRSHAAPISGISHGQQDGPAQHQAEIRDRRYSLRQYIIGFITCCLMPFFSWHSLLVTCEVKHATLYRQLD
ncbi:hypothetical protein CPB85DRAFT_1257046 [Mucidula mucida]|nr:hypothetical protein CPB85DRAFT_1257046 [Mucidula mucida]